MIPTLAPNPTPPQPRAVVARGACARVLARRLERSSTEARASLQLVVAGDVLIVLGPEASLPWVDGVTYLGTTPESPALYLPTTLRSSVSPLLVERAVRRATKVPDGPIALLGLTEVVPLGRAGPLTSAALASFLEARP